MAAKLLWNVVGPAHRQKSLGIVHARLDHLVHEKCT